jgi:hypothetical protein
MIMRSLPLLSLTILLGVVPLTEHAEATESRELRFPPLKDGRLVLSVDTHTQCLLRWARLANRTGLGGQ